MFVSKFIYFLFINPTNYPLFTLLLKPLLPMLLSYTGDGMLGHYIDLALIQQKKAMNINILLKGPGL